MASGQGFADSWLRFQCGDARALRGGPGFAVSGSGITGGQLRLQCGDVCVCLRFQYDHVHVGSTLKTILAAWSSEPDLNQSCAGRVRSR